MLDVRDLSVAYGDLRVLWRVGFTVREDELVVPHQPQRRQ